VLKATRVFRALKETKVTQAFRVESATLGLLDLREAQVTQAFRVRLATREPQD